MRGENSILAEWKCVEVVFCYDIYKSECSFLSPLTIKWHIHIELYSSSLALAIAEVLHITLEEAVFLKTKKQQLNFGLFMHGY